jgi:hypothetical protein
MRAPIGSLKNGHFRSFSPISHLLELIVTHQSRPSILSSTQHSIQDPYQLENTWTYIKTVGVDWLPLRAAWIRNDVRIHINTHNGRKR